MSSSQPQFATTQDALNYQIAQQRANAQKAADPQAKAAADKAYFDAVQSQFRKDQAAAQAQGKTLL